MDAPASLQAMQALLEQNARFFKQSLEQQSETNSRNLNAIAEIVNKLQTRMEDLSRHGGRNHLDSQRSSVTAKRAFAMLPTYSGKPEDFEGWRFQIVQFLSDDPVFPRILEWAEGTLGSDEALHHTAVEELNRESQERVDACKAAMSPPSPARKRKKSSGP